jgi:hypothetical protein
MKYINQPGSRVYVLILFVFILFECCSPSSEKQATAPVEATDAVADSPDSEQIPEPIMEEENVMAPASPPPPPPPAKAQKPMSKSVNDKVLSQSPSTVGIWKPNVGNPTGSTSIPAKNPIPRSQVYDGQMMVYASDSMMEHRGERVMALVKQQIDESKAIQEFGKSMGISESQAANDSKIHDIQLSDSLRVTLVFNPEDFKLISQNAVYYCHFEKRQTQYFDWEVEPQTPGEKQLTIKIENYVNSSWSNFVSPQTITIQVKVNQNTLWTRLWDTIQNDPSWVLDKVMLPLLAFIAGLFATYIRRKLFGRKED